jgi:HAE1 family hydrophobic/amphiphilic exporter-1
LRVHIDPYRMQALGLDTTEVVNALRNANQDFPAGRVQDINRDYSVRLSGKLASPEAFGQITVGVRNGAPIRLDDVAQVLDGQEEYNSLALINGQRALSIEIKSARGANVPPWAMKVVLDEEEFTGAAARPASALADALAEEDDLYRDLNNS